jgi:hypothetical protein
LGRRSSIETQDTKRAEAEDIKSLEQIKNEGSTGRSATLSVNHASTFAKQPSHILEVSCQDPDLKNFRHVIENRHQRKIVGYQRIFEASER